MDTKVEITHSCEYFTSKVEYTVGPIFLHCDVHKNSPQCLKLVKKELKRLLKELGEPLFTYTQNGRYAALLGGKLLNTFESEGKIYEVYVYGT